MLNSGSTSSVMFGHEIVYNSLASSKSSTYDLIIAVSRFEIPAWISPAV